MTFDFPIICFDTETKLFGPGNMAPTVVCASFATLNRGAKWDKKVSQGATGLIHHVDCYDWFSRVFDYCLETGTHLVGHNTAYDLACVGNTWPQLFDRVWDLYDNELVHCTIVRQKLSDLARGRYRGFRTDKGYFVPIKYDLDSVTNRHLGYRLDKDTWRLRYGELLEVPLEQWDEGARTYPIDDAIATLGVFLSQEVDAQTYPQGPAFFVDEHPQTRANWWLHLTSVRGIMTAGDALDRLRDASQEEIEFLEEGLVEAGLVEVTYGKKNGVRKATKKKKPLQALVRRLCEEAGKIPRLTEKGAALVKAGDQSGYDWICTDRDACLETGDPVLEAYVDYTSALKTLNTDVKAYSQGTELPLHTRFESLAATGRTTSSGPNIQNVRWNFPERCTNLECRSRSVTAHKCDKCGAPAAYPPGIRECFVPRPGHVFASADYDGLELRTLAQVCLRLLGYSVLADTLREGKDPHLMVAAQLLHKTYEWCKEHIEDSEVQLARQTGKVANFGFPGGLGAEKLVLFARMAYKVRITKEDAYKLKRTWLRTFPEFADYFKYIDTLETSPGSFSVTHLFSNRLRSDVFYCVACNSFFQGLGADAAKAAGYLVARACYRDEGSPLYGCGIVNFIHDEFIVEVPDDEADGWARATAAANELARLMIEGARPYMPDLDLTTEPQLMRRWSKKAKRIVNKETGLLIPWELS